MQARPLGGWGSWRSAAPGGGRRTAHRRDQRAVRWWWPRPGQRRCCDRPVPRPVPSRPSAARHPCRRRLVRSRPTASRPDVRPHPARPHPTGRSAGSRTRRRPPARRRRPTRRRRPARRRRPVHRRGSAGRRRSSTSTAGTAGRRPAARSVGVARINCTAGAALWWGRGAPSLSPSTTPAGADVLTPCVMAPMNDGSVQAVSRCRAMSTPDTTGITPIVRCSGGKKRQPSGGTGRGAAGPSFDDAAAEPEPTDARARSGPGSRSRRHGHRTWLTAPGTGAC